MAATRRAEATNDVAGIKASLETCASEITALLDALLPVVDGPESRVVDAMRYGVLNGGKRLRPYLTCCTAVLFDVPSEYALRTGAAIEMLHSYSLVHDDLPSMDNSDLRRGRATVHVEYDDATAILAGDGLLTESFAVLASPQTHPDAKVRMQLVSGLASASGAAGRVGGQMIDMSPNRDQLDLGGITRLQALKTGALIRFSCLAGGILGRAGDDDMRALSDYAEDLGLAFQIVDDLLDIEGTAEELGKPTQQDDDAGKATFVGQLGIEGARRMARDLAKSASARLDRFEGRAKSLKEIVEFVIERRS
jgi:farnesyl diphosphate synthase